MHTCYNYNPCTGRQITVTHRSPLQDFNRLTNNNTAIELGISQECVLVVFHSNLQITKVSAHWVTKLLGPNEKWIWHNISRDNLDIFEGDAKRFL